MTTATAQSNQTYAKISPTDLIIRCEEGVNQGIDGDVGQDVFVMRMGDVDRFRVTFFYGDDDHVESTMRVQILTGVGPEQIPGVYGGIDLGYKLYDFLACALAQEEAEFYADLFVDDLGRSRELVMQKMSK